MIDIIEEIKNIIQEAYENSNTKLRNLPENEIDQAYELGKIVKEKQLANKIQEKIDTYETQFKNCEFDLPDEFNGRDKLNV
mgnify:CR=1 FL=1